MSTTKQPEQANALKQHTADALLKVIGEQVIHGLGKPTVPHLVQVRSLWAHFFRVNVLIGEDPTRMKVAHSYFLQADSDGKIVTSTPRIVKQN
jgi:hypothetical protein